jgi:hypothetical protein
MSFEPQRAGGRKRIYIGVLPPRSFITVAMNLTVMGAAERHCELIAHLTAEGHDIVRTASDEDPRVVDRKRGTAAS